jgi:hypothetical protein
MSVEQDGPVVPDLASLVSDLAGQSLVEIHQSQNGNTRSFVTVDEKSVYRVFSECWITYNDEMTPVGFWSRQGPLHFTDSLDVARQRAQSRCEF